VSDKCINNGCAAALESWRRLPLAVVCLMVLGACADLSREQSPASAPEPSRGNATVRAAVYVEAASNVAAAAPALVAESASNSKTPAARGKQDKRNAQSSKKDKPAVAPTLPARRVAASETAGRPIDQKVPLSASGYRYTYAVELDAGGNRTFGFATDQGLLVGDRVLVNDTGVVAVRK
jgi:hypothetical protein